MPMSQAEPGIGPGLMYFRCMTRYISGEDVHMEQPVHPSDSEVVAYALGDLGDSESARLARAVAASPGLAAEVEAIRQVVAMMKDDNSVAPPPRTVARALGLLAEQRPSALAAWLAGGRRVVARLIGDTRAQPALAGFRGQREGFHHAYDCETAMLDLGIAPEGQGVDSSWRVRGQVTSKDGSQANSAVLVRPATGEAVAAAVPDDRGHFRLVVPAGSYDLFVGLRWNTLVVPGVDIG